MLKAELTIKGGPQDLDVLRRALACHAREQRRIGDHRQGVEATSQQRREANAEALRAEELLGQLDGSHLLAA